MTHNPRLLWKPNKNNQFSIRLTPDLIKTYINLYPSLKQVYHKMGLSFRKTNSSTEIFCSALLKCTYGSFSLYTNNSGTWNVNLISRKVVGNQGNRGE